MSPRIPTACSVLALMCAAGPSRAQQPADTLPAVTVYSPSVANQSPAATFAMPVSALRYEPLLDIEPRNMAEAQSDVTIRGDTFESTGLQLGALAIDDPQTGHYLMELPVAPAMLGSPSILTGTDFAEQSMNATGGSVGYGWRPVSDHGFVSGAAGTDGLDREEAYVGAAGSGPNRLAVDADLAHASGNGTVPFGDYHFDRAGARAEWVTGSSQTDLYAGYQASFFGWPNLYTPFDSDETENLETVLVDANTRVDLGGGDYLEGGAFYRRNKDDYAFDRFAPLGPIHPYQHTTREGGAAGGGRLTLWGFVFDFHAEATADSLVSTSLIYGPYMSRTLGKAALVPERSWAVEGGEVTLRAGVTLDESNRSSAAWSPLAELARTWTVGPVHKLYVSYEETTEMPSYTALDSSPTSGLFLGNGHLGRETSRGIEGGVSGSYLSWVGQAAVFYRRDDNLVDWTYEPGVFGRSANPVNVDTGGIELVARRTWERVSVVVGYTALTKSADYLGAQEAASFYALNYARQRLSLALVFGLTRTIELRLDNVARLQAPDSLRTQGGNDALGSSLGLSWRPGGQRHFEIALQVDNLWNSAFQAVPGVPASRRQLSFGATYGW